jgi:hypothetical protein
MSRKAVPPFMPSAACAPLAPLPDAATTGTAAVMPAAAPPIL